MKIAKIIAVLLLFAQTALAQAICPLNGQPLKPKGVHSYESFKRILILENGRIKPLDTYAQDILLQFSGKTTLEHTKAIEWLARLLFAAQLTRNDRVFLINNPVIPESLGLKLDKKRRYSFADLEKIFNKIEELAQAA